MYPVTEEDGGPVIQIDVREQETRRAFLNVMGALIDATAVSTERGGETVVVMATVTPEVASMCSLDGSDFGCFLGFQNRDEGPKYTVVVHLRVDLCDWRDAQIRKNGDALKVLLSAGGTGMVESLAGDGVHERERKGESEVPDHHGR